jgi:hypothetical protein
MPKVVLHKIIRERRGGGGGGGVLVNRMLSIINSRPREYLRIFKGTKANLNYMSSKL